MAVTVEGLHQRSLHPLHAVLLAGTVPLFLGVLFSDIAYSSYEVQWKNFASWLIVGGLLFGGLALLRSSRSAPMRRARIFLFCSLVGRGLHQCIGSRAGRVGKHAFGLSAFCDCRRARVRGDVVGVLTPHRRAK